jgi:UDP-N-acetylmuramate dehydrogenase
MKKVVTVKELGNSGSFFKNPILSKISINSQKFPEMKYYEVSTSEVKVPAGWLIGQAGFKEDSLETPVYTQNQALVLVNYGKHDWSRNPSCRKDIQKTVLTNLGFILKPKLT